MLALMARFQINGLTCDYPGCDVELVRTASPKAPQAYRDRATSDRDWLSVNAKDYCPAHADKARR
jgi:hypothetical protein